MLNMNLPADDFILLSLVNTKLRDCYPSFEDFCDGEDLQKEEILSRLNAAGFVYDERANAFVAV